MMTKRSYYIVDAKDVPEEVWLFEAERFYAETVYGKSGIPMDWEKTRKHIISAAETGYAKGVINDKGQGIGCVVVLKSQPLFSNIDTLVDLCSGMSVEFRDDKEAKKAFMELFEDFKTWAKANSQYPIIGNTAGITNGDFFEYMGLQEVGKVYMIK